MQVGHHGPPEAVINDPGAILCMRMYPLSTQIVQHDVAESILDEPAPLHVLAVEDKVPVVLRLQRELSAARAA